MATSVINDDKKCICCHGKQRLVTDMWNKETMAMWEPCPFCCESEVEAFYSKWTSEDRRQSWYSRGGMHFNFSLTPKEKAVS